MSRKTLSPDLSSFEQMRRGNSLYVDKTEQIWEMIQPASAAYFLSRPRRFGKSLTLTTLKAVFEGKRELFEGLALYDKPYDWKTYPVIHLDMNARRYGTPAELENSLQEIVAAQGRAHGLELARKDSIGMFHDIIEQLSVNERVVVLIDEYDKPILNNVEKPNCKEFLDILKPFYCVVKEAAERIRLTFITGVSKFCHVSLFSDLNNLQDITLNPRFATMQGYTQRELEVNFAPWLQEAEARQSLSHDAFMAKIKEWYDGFRFAADSEAVYNPVSIATFFNNYGEFRNYWFSTGTPSFLMKLVVMKNFDFGKALAEPVDELSFGTFEVDRIEPLPLLLQTGYLTIRSAREEYGTMMYQLGFPNREVSESFDKYLLNAYTGMDFIDGPNFCRKLTRAFVETDLSQLRTLLDAFFAGIQYDVHRKREDNFQNIFLTVFRMVGLNIHAEAKTCDGSIDAAVEVPSAVYIFEFKLNGDSSALEQIRKKTYYQGYLATDKQIFLIGCNFSTKTGRISRWQAEELSR